MNGIEYEMLYTRDEIQKRVKELAKEIKTIYKKDDEIIVIGVLNGAVYFLSDLTRELVGLKIKVDTMSISSYVNGSKESNRQPRILLDTKNSIKDKNVLVVEDMADSGFSLKVLLEMLQARGPKSIKTCVMFSKKDRREVEVHLDFVGFEIPDKWVEGDGLDTDGNNRELPFVVARITR
jgi:hypoxanthine phosphoribosyltransferase